MVQFHILYWHFAKLTPNNGDAMPLINPKSIKLSFQRGNIALDVAMKQLRACGLTQESAVEYVMQGKPTVGKPEVVNVVVDNSGKGLNPIGTRTAKGKNAGTFRMVRRASKSFGHVPARKPQGTHYKPEAPLKLTADTILAIRANKEAERLATGLAANRM